MLIENSVLNLPPRFTDGNMQSKVGAVQANQNLMLIQDLIDRQIWTKQTGLDSAASELGMSSATLKRRLAAMNISYSELLRERRLHHGIRMLERSNLSVKRIARDLGYSAVSNFSRAFSKAKGISPSNWRKNLSVRAVN